MILYVIQFHNGLIKVGKTTRDFELRRYEHVLQNPHLRIVKEYWCETELSELKLIAFCERNGKLHRTHTKNGAAREWFYNLDFETVVSYLKRFAIQIEEVPVPRSVIKKVEKILPRSVIKRVEKILPRSVIKRVITIKELKIIFKERDRKKRLLEMQQERKQLRLEKQKRKEHEQHLAAIKERALAREQAKWKPVEMVLRRELADINPVDTHISDWWKRVL